MKVVPLPLSLSCIVYPHVNNQIWSMKNAPYYEIIINSIYMAFVSPTLYMVYVGLPKIQSNTIKFV